MAGVKEFISGEGDPIEVEEFNCISEDAHDSSDITGFIEVKSEDSKTSGISPFSVSLLSKIKDVRTEGDRDYFTIADTIAARTNYDSFENADLKVSLSRKTDGNSRLGYYDHKKEPITIKLIKSRRLLKIENTYYNIINNPPLPNGTWKIELPLSPHSPGRSYVDMGVNWALIWFPISSESEEGKIDTVSGRYLHVGNITAGCITVQPNNTNSVNKWHNASAKEKRDIWSSIVKILMQYRLDNRSIGYVQSQDEE